ncbi:hypothetical protein KHP11_29195 [Rhodococcus erythropolis]|uniref:hypothetical protein n=1 Tax=Rhodococcus erythropolis TaxID=1833 RepID=UPI0008A3306E|nr:hypothetical protein [Rhodococcus erythropolis]MBT1258535.1 hypothetical protein [Rhodococcus erythropolis]OHF24832.1 hypothetical protein BKP30_27710 [Rhodococcus erythropolis]
MRELGSKSEVGEGGLVVDVVVWTESEERERWWRQFEGIAPSGDRCVARDVGELSRAKDYAASARRESTTVFRAVTAD